jgi:hypothetical protein
MNFERLIWKVSPEGRQGSVDFEIELFVRASITTGEYAASACKRHCKSKWP